MSEQNKVPSWVQKHQAELEKQKTDRSQFVKFSKGETVMEVLLDSPPKEVQKFNKTRYQYRVKINDEVKTLECGSQLDSLIIQALMKNINPMTVIRTGSGLDTQYGIKELD